MLIYISVCLLGRAFISLATPTAQQQQHHRLISASLGTAKRFNCWHRITYVATSRLGSMFFSAH